MSVRAGYAELASIAPRAPYPALAKDSREGTSQHTPCRTRCKPAHFSGKNVHARVIGLLFHLRDPLSRASKNDRAPHEHPTRPNGRLDCARPLSSPLNGCAIETRLLPLGTHVSDWSFTKYKGTCSWLNSLFSETARTSDLLAGHPEPKLPCLRTRTPYAAVAPLSSCDIYILRNGRICGGRSCRSRHLYSLP